MTKQIREKINKVGDVLPISPRLVRIILEEICEELDAIKIQPQEKKSKS